MHFNSLSTGIEASICYSHRCLKKMRVTSFLRPFTAFCYYASIKPRTRAALYTLGWYLAPYSGLDVCLLRITTLSTSQTTAILLTRNDTQSYRNFKPQRGRPATAQGVGPKVQALGKECIKSQSPVRAKDELTRIQSKDKYLIPHITFVEFNLVFP